MKNIMQIFNRKNIKHFQKIKIFCSRTSLITYMYSAKTCMEEKYVIFDQV